MKVGGEDSEENMIGFAHSCTVLLMLYVHDCTLAMKLLSRKTLAGPASRV